MASSPLTPTTFLPNIAFIALLYAAACVAPLANHLAVRRTR